MVYTIVLQIAERLKSYDLRKLWNIRQCLNPNLNTDFECSLTYPATPLSDPAEKTSPPKHLQRKEITKKESLTAPLESLKENLPECIIAEEIWTTCKFINSKIKLVMSLEKKKSKKLLNSFRSMAIQPQLRNSRKSSRPLLKVPSDP